MKRACVFFLLTVLTACGGRLRLGGEGPIIDDGKGTWVVNPVTPEQIGWQLMRGTSSATAPLQTGDWIEVKCTHCVASQKWFTAWTLKAGVIQRTVHLDALTDPASTWQISLEAGEDELRVMWTNAKLDAAPDDFENLNSFSDPRASNVTRNSSFLGELHWGPIDGAWIARRGSRAQRLAGSP